ncbi:MAG: hypothetical protein ACK4PI_05755 [Tepidisphaerales bacterium]
MVVELVSVLMALEAAAPVSAVNVEVELRRVLRSGADRVVGVNVNYLRDSDGNRRPGARPLREALAEMGVKMVRYPGGEKSNFHVWSTPPYDGPRPQALEWYGGVAGEKLDFDAYVGLMRELQAEPFVVVGLDGTPRSGRAVEDWLVDAVGWVRYSNLDRRYGVRLWEVGNENWGKGKRPPDETGRSLRMVARAMKAVDPAIQVGANGMAGSEAWWGPFLAEAGDVIDFASVSLYNTFGWGGYERLLREPGIDLIGDVRAAARLLDRFLPEEKRGRLPIIVTETNSRDYSDGGWPPVNNFGHAVVTFETLARLAGEPRVIGAMVWNTRWVNDDEAGDDQMYALGPLNELTPTGRAVQLWAAFALSNAVAVRVTGGEGHVVGYATVDEPGRAAVVWVVNRGAVPASAALTLADGGAGTWAARRAWRLSASGPDDRAPTWGEVGGAVNPGRLDVLPFSVTVVQLAR